MSALRWILLVALVSLSSCASYTQFATPLDDNTVEFLVSLDDKDLEIYHGLRAQGYNVDETVKILKGIIAQQ